eukprot:m.84092 g.84092  ORF g.84092 m.84092 type:complete len:920 (+) comp8706_c1_seq4:151-2910(+)
MISFTIYFLVSVILIVLGAAKAQEQPFDFLCTGAGRPSFSTQVDGDSVTGLYRRSFVGKVVSTRTPVTCTRTFTPLIQQVPNIAIIFSELSNFNGVLTGRSDSNPDVVYVKVDDQSEEVAEINKLYIGSSITVTTDVWSLNANIVVHAFALSTPQLTQTVCDSSSIPTDVDVGVIASHATVQTTSYLNNLDCSTNIQQANSFTIGKALFIALASGDYLEHIRGGELVENVVDTDMIVVARNDEATASSTATSSLRFTTDSSNVQLGFRFLYFSVPETTYSSLSEARADAVNAYVMCSDTSRLYSGYDEVGTIFSHSDFGTSDFNPGSGEDCVFSIDAPQDYRIRLLFKYLNLGSGAELQAYIGSEQELVQEGRLIVSEPGASIDLRLIAQSGAQGEGFIVNFQVVPSYVSTTTFDESAVSYFTICSGNEDHQTNFGVVYSHSEYGMDRQPYPNGLDCTFTLIVPSNEYIHLNFDEISLGVGASLVLETGADQNQRKRRAAFGIDSPIALDGANAIEGPVTLQFVTSTGGSDSTGFRVLYQKSIDNTLPFAWDEFRNMATLQSVPATPSSSKSSSDSSLYFLFIILVIFIIVVLVLLVVWYRGHSSVYTLDRRLASASSKRLPVGENDGDHDIEMDGKTSGKANKNKYNIADTSFSQKNETLNAHSTSPDNVYDSNVIIMIDPQTHARIQESNTGSPRTSQMQKQKQAQNRTNSVLQSPSPPPRPSLDNGNGNISTSSLSKEELDQKRASALNRLHREREAQQLNIGNAFSSLDSSTTVDVIKESTKDRDGYQLPVVRTHSTLSFDSSGNNKSQHHYAIMRDVPLEPKKPQHDYVNVASDGTPDFNSSHNPECTLPSQDSDNEHYYVNTAVQMRNGKTRNIQLESSQPPSSPAHRHYVNVAPNPPLKVVKEQQDTDISII